MAESAPAAPAAAGQKRARADSAPDMRLSSPVVFTAVKPRPRMCLLPLKKKAPSTRSGGEPAVAIPVVRPPVQQHLDDYLTLVGNMYYTSPEVGKSTEEFALIRRTTLGTLTSPLREPSVLDKWSPYEIALFESSICLVGKNFTSISSVIGSKTPSEVTEFYYTWKKGKNYAAWKAAYKHTFEEAE